MPIPEIDATIQGYQISNHIGLQVREMNLSVPADTLRFAREAHRVPILEARKIGSKENFARVADLILSKQPESHFYLTASVPETYDWFIQRFGKKVIFHHRDWFDRRIEENRAAVVDMVNLSRTRFVISSVFISFSRLALLKGTRVISIAKVSSNPSRLNHLLRRVT